MSYGPNVVDVYRRGAIYVDRKPTNLSLVLNLKSAKKLGLTIPPPPLQRADQVIE